MEVAGRPSADQQVSNSNCDPCKYTGDSAKSVSFCIDCIEYLCMNCLKHHKKTKVTRDHKTLEGNAVPSNRDAFERMQSIALCPEHVDQKVIYKCTDHSVYACLKCVRSVHMTCKSLVDITNLQDTEHTSDIIRSHISKMEEKQSDAHKTIGNVILKLNQEKDKVLEKREKLMDKLRSFLVQLEQSTESIKGVVKAECECIQAETRPILKKFEAYTTDANFLQTVIDFGNPIQVCIAAQEQRAYNTDNLHLNENDYSYHIDDTLDDSVYDLFEKLQEPNLLLHAGEDKHGIAKNLLQDADAAQARIQVDKDKRKVPGAMACTTEHVKNVAKPPIKAEQNTSSPVDLRISPIISKKHISGTIQDTHNDQILTILSLDGSVSPSEDLQVAADSQGFIFVILCQSEILLILNKNFCVWKRIPLDTTPTSICSVGNGQHAVALADKRFKRYFAGQSGVFCLNTFHFKDYCVSLSRYGDDHVVCLCFNQQKPLFKQSHAFIEIRDYTNGRIHKAFPYSLSANTKATVSSVYSRQLGEIIVCSNRSIEFLSEVGDRIRIFEWSGIVTSITADRCGNLYIFDKTKDSIFYISKNTYKILFKVIELKGLSAAAITYNAEEHNLIMVCSKTGSQ